MLRLLVPAQVGDDRARAVLGLDLGGHLPDDIEHFGQARGVGVAEVGQRRDAAAVTTAPPAA
ncbi:hypothetical protein GCM10020000_85620 [Streptomyces olivoverticillatus]